MTKLRIDFSAGLIEVEGEEEFVRGVYLQYKDQLLTTPKNAPARASVPASAAEPAAPTPRIASRPRRRESASIVKDLDLSSKGGKQSLREFHEAKAPRDSSYEQNVVFVYYLQHVAKVDRIGVDHVYSCYKDVGVRVPGALNQSLRDTAFRKGWIDTADMDSIRTTTPGENFVEHDLPQADTTRK